MMRKRKKLLMDMAIPPLQYLELCIKFKKTKIYKANQKVPKTWSYRSISRYAEDIMKLLKGYSDTTT